MECIYNIVFEDSFLRKNLFENNTLKFYCLKSDNELHGLLGARPFLYVDNYK